jgi:hypothetical protein
LRHPSVTMAGLSSVLRCSVAYVIVRTHQPGYTCICMPLGTSNGPTARLSPAPATPASRVAQGAALLAACCCIHSTLRQNHLRHIGALHPVESTLQPQALPRECRPTWVSHIVASCPNDQCQQLNLLEFLEKVALQVKQTICVMSMHDSQW